jgi:hypothetical protein
MVVAISAPLLAARIAYYRTTFDQLLTTGEAVNPRATLGPTRPDQTE